MTKDQHTVLMGVSDFVPEAVNSSHVPPITPTLGDVVPKRQNK